MQFINGVITLPLMCHEQSTVNLSKAHANSEKETLQAVLAVQSAEISLCLILMHSTGIWRLSFFSVIVCAQELG